MLLRLPDSPTDAKFLTEEERTIAVERLKENKAGYKNTQIDRGQILEAFTDPQTWLLAVLVFACDVANGGFTTVTNPVTAFENDPANMFQFNSLVLKGFGYDTFHTLLMGLPGGVIVCAFVFLA